MINHIRSIAILSLLSCFLLTSCSKNATIGADSAVKHTVLTVADRYLQSIAAGNSRLVDKMVLWSVYSDDLKQANSRLVVLENVKVIKGKWSNKQHPLLGLDLLDVEVSGDDAEIILAKPQGKKKVKLQLAWGGNSWLIVNDNLFGKNGYLTLSGPESDSN